MGVASSRKSLQSVVEAAESIITKSFPAIKNLHLQQSLCKPSTWHLTAATTVRFVMYNNVTHIPLPHLYCKFKNIYLLIPYLYIS